MGVMTRTALLLTVLSLSTHALAQTPPPPVPTTPTAPTMPTAPPVPAMPTPAAPAMPTAPTAPTAPAMPPPADTGASVDKKPDDKGEKQPKAGDFDAGGQARFPSGPDEMGAYASVNWVAVDAKATYYLLPSVTATAVMPLAVKKPDTINGGMTDPSMIGGVHMKLDAWIPKLPKLPGIKYDTKMGLTLGLAYMRENALLLSDKDFPVFVGDFQPGVSTGLIMGIKLSSVVDFNLNPVLLLQKGETKNHSAIQVPVSLVLKAGSAIKLALESAVNTGDDISLRGSNGGRIMVGGSLDLKIGKIIIHTGAGLASLLTGPAYPNVTDSVFVDINAKYAK
jgi:hypothetical protein